MIQSHNESNPSMIAMPLTHRLRRFTLALFVTVPLICNLAHAHHSSAMFDYSHYVLVDGTIKSFLYQSPHAWISLIGHQQGKNGEPEQWDVEAVAPVLLSAMGITKETFKPGDKVTVALYPLKDGRRAGALINITNGQGKTLGSKLPTTPVQATK